jgi:hypothetical protein
MIARTPRDAINILLGNPPKGPVYGMIAEFETPGELIHACEAVRDKGFKYWDAHTPFPLHGMDEAMGLGPCIVPWIVLGGGLTGLAAGLALQLWVNLIAYPLVIAGKPFNSFPAFMPVAFELTILFASFGAVIGMLVANFLPMIYHPLFGNDRFKSASHYPFIISN